MGQACLSSWVSATFTRQIKTVQVCLSQKLARYLTSSSSKVSISSQTYRLTNLGTSNWCRSLPTQISLCLKSTLSQRLCKEEENASRSVKLSYKLISRQASLAMSAFTSSILEVIQISISTQTAGAGLTPEDSLTMKAGERLSLTLGLPLTKRPRRNSWSKRDYLAAHSPGFWAFTQRKI